VKKIWTFIKINKETHNAPRIKTCEFLKI